ncbi:hypothetical protein D4R42_03605 [bacterium]|nr:MAG: hypothetical protein D4R42_03605 [bacterium]
MNTKIISVFIGIAVIIAGGAFYGGMKYGQNRGFFNQSSRQGFQNLSSEQRAQFSQGRMASEVASNFLNGEVINKDEKSLTLGILDGGSKIIFFSDSTQISKTIDGSINDIEVGKQIIVGGDKNEDGSYTAKTIQLSPR